MLLADRLKPKTIKDIIGHKSQINKIIKWLKNWKNEKFKALLLYGPAGIGKTTCAHIIPKQMKYEVVERNSSDKRSAAAVKELTEIVETLPLFQFLKSCKSGRLLVLDEVDGLSAGDRGGVCEIKKLIEKTCIPIICIANDVVGTKLTPLKKVCMKIEFIPPGPKDSLPVLCKLFPKLTKKQITKIIMSTKGDVRHLLNMLQFGILNTGKDLVKRDMDITESVRHLINEAKLNAKQKSDLFYSNYDLMPFYIQELYLQYMKSIKSVAKAADTLSTVNCIQDYIMQNQDWNLINYIEHFTVNVASQKGQYNSPFIPFPQSLSKLSKANKYKRILTQSMITSSALEQTGLNHETAGYIYNIKLKKLVDETATKEDLKYAADLFNEKDEIYDVLETFYQKKVPTAMKRKITAVYKEKPTKDIKDASKKTSKVKPKVKKTKVTKSTVKKPKVKKPKVEKSKVEKTKSNESDMK